MKTLYIVATPIGNMEDMTFRALRVLKEADIILCEDTRVTKKLLDKYEVTTPTISYHSHSKMAKTERILAFIEEGGKVAMVSDAGTPTISDPGVLLVKLAYERFGGDIRIEPIPGASALIAALSASGISSAEFIFLGFLPRKKGRKSLFKEIADSKRTVVFYESPHRIMKTLSSLKSVFGDNGISGRRLVIARELTKIHEEFLIGTPEYLYEKLFNDAKKQKGEFVVIVEAL